MTKRAWVKDEMTGKWSSFDPVIRRQVERKAAKEAAERAEAMKDKTGFIDTSGGLVGVIAAVAYPPANALAVRLRDWLYGLFRKGPDESDEAGA